GRSAHLGPRHRPRPRPGGRARPPPWRTGLGRGPRRRRARRRLRRRAPGGGAVRRLGLLLAVMALLGLACGVPEDSSPQELSTDEIPESLQGAPTTTTSVPDDPGPGQEATLYFVDADNRVV